MSAVMPGKLQKHLTLIARLYKQGWSTRAIAQLLGCSKEGVRLRLIQLDIPVRERWEHPTRRLNPEEAP